MRTFLMVAGLAWATWAASAAHWTSDFNAAQTRAYGENKKMLVLFTGSDWCPACINLKKTALSDETFSDFAEQNVVLAEVDFPRQRAISAAQKQANEALAVKYQIQYYPTLLLIDGQGKKLAQVTAIPDGPQLVQEIKKKLAQAAGAKPEEEPPPMFNGAEVKPPPRYTELKLQGISGPAGRKLAIVNSQTMGVGESAHITLGGRDVKVRCVEIRQKSVVLAVEGHNQEVHGSW